MLDLVFTVLFLGAAAIGLLLGLALLTAPLHLWLQWKSERVIEEMRGN